MKFIIATNNPKKLVELSRILNPLGIDAISAKEAGITIDDVEETGTTFAENAFIKAKTAFERTGIPAIADDSGLSVDALDGRPGIFTARYGGDGLTDEDRYLKLLDELKNVPEEKRTANFSCAICCIISDLQKIEVEGKCFGKIAFEPSKGGGFGYDPIFMYEDKCFSQLTADEKDAVSHRGQALRKLQAELKKLQGNT